MKKYFLLLTLPLIVAFGLFPTFGQRGEADQMLSELLISWQTLAPEEIQLRLHADPIIDGIVLWESDQKRTFPAVDQMVHISQQPYLADLKRLESLRDEADPISTELKSKNGDTHYWCKSVVCLIIDGPALAEVMGLEPEDHKTIFEPTSIGLVHLAVMSFVAGLAVWCYRRVRCDRKAPSILGRDDDAFDFGPVRISPARMSAMIGAHSSDLTPRDLKLIMLMRHNQDFVLSKDQLYNAGWGRDFMPNSRALEQHMLTLRRKLDPDRSNKSIIETVHGQGYRFGG